MPICQYSSQRDCWKLLSIAISYLALLWTRLGLYSPVTITITMRSSLDPQLLQFVVVQVAMKPLVPNPCIKQTVTTRSCSKWPCWKWIFPSRIGEYEDFATAAQMGEIYALRQTARKQFEPTLPEDDKMLQHLWDGLYPTLPYEGRVNVRWRDVGFQNDDPASDLRTSGRLAIQMLLYFSDHLNDEFKRIIRENRFPMCICALNLLEVLLCHLKLKEPLPLVCPCCGTENAELETSKKPSQTHPELCGFIALVEDASAHQISFSGGGPAETALAHIFVHSLLVMDGVWKQQLQRDPTTTLMHFREALVETRVRIVAFLSRRQMRLTLKELDKWGYRQRARCQ
ncbi:engulfment and cell motility elm family protein [Plasmopara halstedii]|uniref:Engulfment and cell motility elm family protein n=1 Tax=Plasmopara halstedii TaxID=4781 RepID=A0A0P1A9K7_PLAHL|nr:engulfment and cell motility elm family protein [Plasmopara halstedii]CEG36948.1 engulfment and cell motility elm family protein [Plasmopara halstedii]|eukprot:XP_024573317.1 engulfment and cell motility elm family protein [Plasmopara halstedii]